MSLIHRGVCVAVRCRSELVITVAPVAIRAAFSNIHTWTVLKGDLQLASQVSAAPVVKLGVADINQVCLLSTQTGLLVCWGTGPFA